MNTRLHRLVVRTSRCGRDNPDSTPGVDIWLAEARQSQTAGRAVCAKQVLPPPPPPPPSHPPSPSSFSPPPFALFSSTARRIECDKALGGDALHGLAKLFQDSKQADSPNLRPVAIELGRGKILSAAALGSWSFQKWQFVLKQILTQAGLESAIFGSEDQRLIH